ncbi:hypothetical protein U9M48_039486 [Paspalum notatum var. saurae]|uniref:Uncharacterized protein n=1 Tax=Paspalum notatum var. saurae TaxID=547442 RepID=A0AAQ3UKU2_PASNO
MLYGLWVWSWGPRWRWLDASGLVNAGSRWDVCTRNEVWWGERKELTGVEEETQIYGERIIPSKIRDHADEDLDETHTVMPSDFTEDGRMRRKSPPNVARIGEDFNLPA